MLIEFHRRMLADQGRSAAFHEALRRVIRPGDSSVADVGAGTGVLGFLARRLGAREVHLIEHGRVMELAERIAMRNGLDGLELWPMHSTEILDPPQVDVVVCEVLGNLAFEENVIETIADAWRFLKPGGVLIPGEIEQFILPVATPRFRDELCSWDRTGIDLDFSDARNVSFDNVYVHRFGPADLLGGEHAAKRWDHAKFTPDLSGERRGSARWSMPGAATIHGFALWWNCVLVPGVSLTTSPFAAPTHWDQVYLPIASPIAAQSGDEVEITLESETGGGAGIGFRWTAIHRRGARELSAEQRDIGRGFIQA
jgi:protein arginine N-methyltransferase 1